jgi:di/tricarboxylate transporter
MSPALASLLALVAAIVLSMTTRINVGLIALVLAWLVGAYDESTLGLDAVTRAFPSMLFLTVLGVTALFAASEANGTLERLARRASRLAFGDARWLGPVFFTMACLLAAAGPGAVPTVALLAPMAMAVGTRAGMSPFLIAIVVANGANAGNLSPFSAVGIIANTKMAAFGMGGHEVKVMFANFAASLVVAAAAYVLFGGLRRGFDSPGGFAPADPPTRSLAGAPAIPAPFARLARPARSQHPLSRGGESEDHDDSPVAGALCDTNDVEPVWTWRHGLTLAAIVAWVLGVVFFKWNLGLSALAASVFVIATGGADETATLKRIPWGVVLMVSGVSTLVDLLDATGGLDLFTSVLSRFATADSANAVMAFVTGAISLYSSTAGVVLPAFLPTVPGLVDKLGGGDPLAIALSVNVGASLVDVSPLSTMGALCLAAAPATAEPRRLFRKLTIWGFSMAFVGAIICQLFAGVISRF